MAAFADNVVSSFCPKPLRVLLKDIGLREASDGEQRATPQAVTGDDAAGFGGPQDRTRPRSDASDRPAPPALGQSEPARVTVAESCAFEPSSPLAGNSTTPAPADGERDPASRSEEKSRVDELRDELVSYREERKRAVEESERFSRELEKLRAAVEERDREVLALKALGLGVETGKKIPGHMPGHAQNTGVPPAVLLKREGSGRRGADSRPEEGPPWRQDWQEMCDLAMQPENPPRPAFVWTGDARGAGLVASKAPELSWNSERAIFERDLSLAGAEGGASLATADPAYSDARLIRAAREAADVRNDEKPEPTNQNASGSAYGQSGPRERRTGRDAFVKPGPSSAPASPTLIADNRHPGFPAPPMGAFDFERPTFEAGFAAPGDDRGGRGFLSRDCVSDSAASRDARPANPAGDRKPDGDRAKPQAEPRPEEYMAMIVKEKEKCEKYMSQTKRFDDELHRKLAFCAELLRKPAGEPDDNDDGGGGGAKKGFPPDAPANGAGGDQFRPARKISYRHPSATFPGSATVS